MCEHKWHFGYLSFLRIRSINHQYVGLTLQFQEWIHEKWPINVSLSPSVRMNGFTHKEAPYLERQLWLKFIPSACHIYGTLRKMLGKYSSANNIPLNYPSTFAMTFLYTSHIRRKMEYCWLIMAAAAQFSLSSNDSSKALARSCGKGIISRSTTPTTSQALYYSIAFLMENVLINTIT